MRIPLMLTGALLLVGVTAKGQPDEGLVAHWTFDEGAGDVLHDRSGNGNDGKIHGPKWVKNGQGYALEFDGVDDYVDCGDNPALDLRDTVSMEMWVWIEPRYTAGEPGIAGKAFGAYVFTQYGSRVHAYIGGGPHNTCVAVPQRSWHYVASTYDGKVLRIYLDGQLANDAILNKKPLKCKNFCMGKSSLGSEWAQGARFSGRLAEVRVYDRALTADVIARNFRTSNITNAPTLSVMPLPWQDRIAAGVGVRGFGEKQPDLTAALALHRRGPDGNPVGPALAEAAVSDFNFMRCADASVPVPGLPAGDYVIQAAAVTPDGKPIGDSATVEVKWARPQRFPRGPEGARQLNKLVTELLNVAGGDTAQSWPFTNPRTGWVFVSNAGSPEVTLSGPELAKPMKVVLSETQEGAREAMRCLPRGAYQISTPQAKDLIVRAIPHLVFVCYDSEPKVKQFGPYAGAFHEKYVFKNINTFVGSRRTKTDDLKNWKDGGQKWLAQCGVLYDKPDHPVTVEDALNYLATRQTIDNPYFDGLIADEFGNSARHCDPWADAVDRFFSQPKHKDKIYVPFASNLWNGEPGRKLARAVMKHNGGFALKVYLKEQRTDMEARDFIEACMVKSVQGYEENLPGSVPHVIICFGWFLCAPLEALDTLPHVNFKTYIDMQTNIVANHPTFENIGGIMSYAAGYADEETVRWTMRIFRHYGIEGRTEMLSGDPYILNHVEDPDFEMRGKGWTLQPAEDGSIRFDTHSGFAFLAQRYPRGCGDGLNVLVTKRSAARPNLFSTEIRNLEPGRLYNLRMFSGDFNDLSKKELHAVTLELDNVEPVPERCFTTPVPNCYAHKWGPYQKQGDAWTNYYWRVFRAKGTTARLSLSDWASAKVPAGPVGQELMFNFVQIQPYLEP